MRPAWLVRLGLFLYDHLGGRKLLPATRVARPAPRPGGPAAQARIPQGLRVFRLLGRRCPAGRAQRARRPRAGRGDPDPHGTRERAPRGWRSGRSSWRTGATAAGGAFAPRRVVNAAGPWVEQVLGGAIGREQRPARAAGQGQPSRHPQVLGRRPSLSAAEHRQAGDLRQSLRGRPRPDRHHRHPGRGSSGGRRDRRRRRSTTCWACSRATSASRQAKTTSSTASAACGRSTTTVPRTPRRSPATTCSMSSRRQPDARPGAPALGLRRQDHDLPQARRARARQADAVLSAARPRLDRGARRCRAATCRMPTSSAGWQAFGPAGPGCPQRLPGTTAASTARVPTRCLPTHAGLGDLGRHFGANLYEREARFLLREEWAETAEDILTRRTKHGLHLGRAQVDAFDDWLSTQARACQAPSLR